ncbi:hypothetical protein [Streptomyces sp. NPDC008125]|uniref:MmyB family transcriptional regulator n=1 Tax=Streptomyces sp. NPDC008125 TaxID=3364811 RepID=UPI0036E0111A
MLAEEAGEPGNGGSDAGVPVVQVAVGGARDDDRLSRRWWGARHLACQGTGTKILHHPVAGELTLDRSFLTCADGPGQRIVTLTAERGTVTHAALRALALEVVSGRSRPVPAVICRTPPSEPRTGSGAGPVRGRHRFDGGPGRSYYSCG